MPSDFFTRDSGERKEFGSGMVRDTDEDKVKWHLVSSGPMLKRWAELLTRGAQKYTEDNWMKANGDEEYERFRASAFRHFMQWYYGLNPEEDHAAAVMFNINGAEYTKGQPREDFGPGDSLTEQCIISGIRESADEYRGAYTGLVESMQRMAEFVANDPLCDPDEDAWWGVAIPGDE